MPGKNAFLFFLDEFRTENRNRRQSELFQEAGHLWRQMSAEDKVKYFQLAKPLRPTPPSADGDQAAPEEALADILKREPPLRELNFIDKRSQKLRAEEQKKRIAFSHIRTIVITVVVGMAAYYIARFY